MAKLPFWEDQPIQTDAMSWIPYHPKVEQAFKLEDKFGGVLQLSLRAGDLLGIPRNCAPVGEFDRRVNPNSVDINCKVPPRNEEQYRVINEIIGHFEADQSHVFRATTGFGKTYVALAATARMKTPTLIVVTKDDLMEQWRRAILGDPEKGTAGYLDVAEDDVGMMQADTCEWEGKKIVIGMVHSLAKDKYGDTFKKHFGLVIFDEVHRMGADTFSEVCKMFPAKYRLGLSATPSRTDGRDFVFEAHIGPVLVVSDLQNMPLKVIIQPTGWKVPVVQQWEKTPMGWQQFIGPLKHEPDRMMKLYGAMAESESRNSLIVEFVKMAYQKSRRIIVFSHLKNHLTTLYDEVLAAGIPSADMAYYIGGMSEKKRDVAKTKRILWATYAMTKEATDIPALDTAVLATPAAHVKQAVGRILRVMEGKNQAVVFDLVDDGSEVLGGFAGSRQKEYLSLKATLVQLTTPD